MLYRKLDLVEAERLMSFCEENDHRYEVWNMADVILGDQIAEIGVYWGVWQAYDTIRLKKMGDSCQNT